MKRLIQPNIYTCGQTCVAMAAGISTEEVINLCGHRNVTSVKELRQMLASLGFQARRVKPRRTLPQRALCLITKRKTSGWRKTGHWVLVWDGQIYDPFAPQIMAVISIGRRKK